MKEITLKFESQEAYDEFMNSVILTRLKEQQDFPEQVFKYKLEYDLEKNIGTIKNN